MTRAIHLNHEAHRRRAEIHDVAPRPWHLMPKCTPNCRASSADQSHASEGVSSWQFAQAHCSSRSCSRLRLSAVAPTVQCSPLRACALPASPKRRARSRGGCCARRGGRPSRLAWARPAIILSGDAQHARLHRRQRAGLRERRTLRATPVDARATRRGRGTQPAPGGCARHAAGDGGSNACSSIYQSKIARAARALRSATSLSSHRVGGSALGRAQGPQLGVSFRRQVPVAGLFIADFCAPSIKLIVEVDGPIHARKLGPDARRDRKLQPRWLPHRPRQLSARPHGSASRTRAHPRRALNPRDTRESITPDAGVISRSQRAAQRLPPPAARSEASTL
jgi:very-short-patch-repair endonuclease